MQREKSGIKVFLLVVLILGLLGGGIFYVVQDSNMKDSQKKNDVSIEKNEEKREKEIDDKVTSVMKEMSIEDKIAQMLIVYYMGEEVDEKLDNVMKSHTPGGFIVMKSNITTYEGTKKFISDLKGYSDIPLIVGMDQEGGSVQRLSNISDVEVTDIPYMYDLGSTSDTKLAYDVGKVMAEELRTIGVNMVFAPVLDVYMNENNTVIGKRSFGRDAEMVANMATSLAKGLEDNGVIATYKHFPGHGDTEVDSHDSLPVISKSYEEFKNIELVPFEKAIENNAKAIMVGHIAVPSITGNNDPASMSSKIITDILRNDMKYDGLVVTDGLNMGAVTKNYTAEQIYVKAIEAGSDLLLMPNGSSVAIDCIKKNISEDRIDESVEKILKFKYRYLSDYKELDKSYLGSEDHKKVVDKIKVVNNTSEE